MRNRTILLVLAFVFAVGYRFFVSLNIRFAAMTKKEYQEYRSRHSALKRWFFINASRFCKDKYSRGERKIVHHSKHVLLYSVSTILLYTILLGLSVLFFLYLRGILADKVCDCAFLFYYCYFLLLFVLLYFIEGIRNKEYHKSRHR